MILGRDLSLGPKSPKSFKEVVSMVPKQANVQKAIEAVKSGKTVQEASKMFNLNSNVLRKACSDAGVKYKTTS